MQTYRELLTAGEPLTLAINGKELFITRCTAGPVLTVEFVVRQSEGGKLRYVGKGLQCMPDHGFEGIKITSPVNCEVDFVVTEGGFDLKFNEDEAIIGNDDTKPIPVKNPAGGVLLVSHAPGQRVDVDIGGGVVNVTADNVGVNNTDVNPVPVRQVAGDDFAVTQVPGDVFAVAQAQAAALAAATVAATDAICVLLAASAARRGFYVRNAGPDPVALVEAGGTFANAAIVLQAGETWKEDIAAAAAWHCLCDAGKTAAVKVLGAA